jgi:SAM-dependent methyltransferase
METRKQKEQNYHNKAFSEGTRKKADKYYAITKKSSGFYESFLRAHCNEGLTMEYGCGPGSSAFVLAEQAIKVIGIDISDVGIKQALTQAQNKCLPNVSFFVMDAEALAIADNKFDLICGNSILHHLELKKAFAEITRTLKTNGMAIFLEPLGHNPMINLYRKLTPRFRTEDEHPLLMQDLNIAHDYFEKIETHFFHLFSLAAVPFRKLPGFRLLLRFLDALDGATFKILPFIKKYAWIIVIVLAQPKKVH